jgi:predicted lipid-binding transport protein (Tim44 family)
MRKRPIGQILVEKNEISEAELAAALAEQERTGLRLGQILIETGRISWLALARAIAEQVLDIEDVQPQPTAPRAAPAAPAAPPPVPAPAEVVAWSATPTPAPAAAPPPAPAPAPVAAAAPAPVAPELIRDPEIKLHSVEALLKERQRAFIELVTTTETLRMKVAHLEEIIDERDRELTRLRVIRAS